MIPYFILYNVIYAQAQFEFEMNKKKNQQNIRCECRMDPNEYSSHSRLQINLVSR